MDFHSILNAIYSIVVLELKSITNFTVKCASFEFIGIFLRIKFELINLFVRRRVLFHNFVFC